MSKIYMSLCSAVIALAALSCTRSVVTADYGVIPLPMSVTEITGKGFTVDRSTRIYYEDHGDGDMFRNANFLSEYIASTTGYTLNIGLGERDNPVGGILLRIDPAVTQREGYQLNIGEDGIVVSGGSAAGVFYGIQTLRKSIPARALKNKLVFPPVIIRDAPAFSYRGIMIDVARNYYGLQSLYDFIDLMALHNINTFHWHLTDDQGWRIEIKKYPLLTEVGGFRKDTVTGELYGGFLTQDEIRDVVRYASDRYVTVIPEIDMPGHMLAALASYPELGCTGGPYEITGKPGVMKDILCVGNPETMRFVKDVLGEVMELFPSEYIHIGGDESPRDRWRVCPRCQALIREEGITAEGRISAEDKLQGWFNHEIEEFLSANGKKLIGWDEIVEGGLSRGATVMSWRGTEGGVTAARHGHDVIMTPNGSFYFDYSQSRNAETEPVSMGGYVPLGKVYHTRVVPEELTAGESVHIKGPQANLWTTYIPTLDTAEYMLLPRMAALAEVAWVGDSRKDFNYFLVRLQRLVRFYERDGYTYAPHYYDIGPAYEQDYTNRTLQVNLSTLEGAEIFYTLDGGEPDQGSTPYTGTIYITEDTHLRATAYYKDIPSEYFERTVTFNKATLRPIELLTPPDPRYSGKELNDGIRATVVFSDGGWTGWHRVDPDIVIDLGSSQTISSVEVGTLTDHGAHIADAAGITFLVSDDGVNFHEVASLGIEPDPFRPLKSLQTHRVEFPETKARYARLKVRRTSILPGEEPGVRIQPFVFIDEISID